MTGINDNSGGVGENTVSAIKNTIIGGCVRTITEAEEKIVKTVSDENQSPENHLLECFGNDYVKPLPNIVPGMRAPYEKYFQYWYDPRFFVNVDDYGSEEYPKVTSENLTLEDLKGSYTAAKTYSITDALNFVLVETWDAPPDKEITGITVLPTILVSNNGMYVLYPLYKRTPRMKYVACKPGHLALWNEQLYRGMLPLSEDNVRYYQEYLVHKFLLDGCITPEVGKINKIWSDMCCKVGAKRADTDIEDRLDNHRGQRSKRPNTKPGSNPSSPIKPSIANKSKQAAAAELKSKKHLAFGTNGPLVPQLVTVPEKQQEGNEDKSKSGPPTNVAVTVPEKQQEGNEDKSKSGPPTNVAVTPEIEKTAESQPETMRAVPPQTSDVTNSAPTPAEPAQTFKATVAQYPTTPAVTQSLLQLQEPPTIDAATQQTPNVTPAIPPQQQQQPATTPAPYMGYFQPGNEGYGNPNWSSFTTDNQFNQQQFNPQQYNHNQYSGRPYGEEVGQVDFDRLKHLTGTDVNLLFGTDDTNNVGRPNAVEVLDDPSAALDNNGTSNLITLESVLVPSRGNPSGSSTASAASDASSRRSSNPSGSSSLSSKSVDIPLDWAQRFQSMEDKVNQNTQMLQNIYRLLSGGNDVATMSDGEYIKHKNFLEEEGFEGLMDHVDKFTRFCQKLREKEFFESALKCFAVTYGQTAADTCSEFGGPKLKDTEICGFVLNQESPYNIGCIGEHVARVVANELFDHDLLKLIKGTPEVDCYTIERDFPEFKLFMEQLSRDTFKLILRKFRNSPLFRRATVEHQNMYAKKWGQVFNVSGRNKRNRGKYDKVQYAAKKRNNQSITPTDASSSSASTSSSPSASDDFVTPTGKRGRKTAANSKQQQIETEQFQREYLKKLAG